MNLVPTAATWSAAAAAEAAQPLHPVIITAISSAVTAIIVAAIAAVMNRRKLSAEATEIITKASTGVVERVEADNARLRQEQQALSRRLDHIVEVNRVREQRQVEHLTLWHRYCATLGDALRSRGGQVPDPPPMWVELPDYDTERL